MNANPKDHPIYSRDATVYLESGIGNDKLETFHRAIEVSDFHHKVDAVLRQSGKPPQDFLIAIKPNIMTASNREDASPVYTDPQLVERLIERLRLQGYSNIVVVESRNVYDFSYQGRSVKAVAEMLGYSGNGYRIADLSEENEQYDYGGVLGLHPAGIAWRDADYRISFAKNKTHWQCYYTGCMKNVYGCLPEWNKLSAYHGKDREFYECSILILENFPVHFGFLDAWVSADGFSGHVRDGKPNLTETIFASENIFALDWVMGEKMGLDPMMNSVIKEAARQWKTPKITRRGDLSPWKPWTNVRPFTVAALDVIEEHYWMSRFFSRSFASQQDKRFPPVSRMQWLFGIFQKIFRFVERVLVSKT